MLLKSEKAFLTKYPNTPWPNHTSVLEIIYENQRTTTFSSQNYFSANLSDTEFPWTDALNRSYSSLDQVALPYSSTGGDCKWFWLTDWRCFEWMYAVGFNDAVWKQAPVTSYFSRYILRFPAEVFIF